MILQKISKVRWMASVLCIIDKDINYPVFVSFMTSSHLYDSDATQEQNNDNATVTQLSETVGVESRCKTPVSTIY